MANVTGSFTALNQNSASGLGHIADVIIGGTFVGTVVLEVAIPDATGAKLWVPVAPGITAPGYLGLPNGAIGAQVREWRARCSAFTSGTISYALGACACEDNIDMLT